MTEREALRLLHLDKDCSQEQLRRAYRDLVKVWHPDRFQSDVQLRAKAERTLQSINEAYALCRAERRVQRPPLRPTRTTSQNQPRPSGLPRGRRRATAAKGRSGLRAISCSRRRSVQRWAWPWRYLQSCDGVRNQRRPRTPPRPKWPRHQGLLMSSRMLGRDCPRPGNPPAPHSRVRGRPVDRPGASTGQVSARNATAWDAAVLLDGPSGARGFFLRPGEQVTLLDVAPGTYGVRVMFGATWTGRAFAQGATSSSGRNP